MRRSIARFAALRQWDRVYDRDSMGKDVEEKIEKDDPPLA
jgi:hypothetical protein